MSIRWVEHRGRRILYHDMRNLSGKEAIESIELLGSEVAASPTRVLVLSNFEGASASRDWMSHAKKLGKGVFAAKVEKGATVGVSGVQGVLLEGYEVFTGRSVKNFKTEAQALDWLAKD